MLRSDLLLGRAIVLCPLLVASMTARRPVNRYAREYLDASSPRRQQLETCLASEE